MPDNTKKKIMEDKKLKADSPIGRGPIVDKGPIVASKGEGDASREAKGEGPFSGGAIHYGSRPFYPPPVYGIPGSPFPPPPGFPTPGWHQPPGAQQRGPQESLFEKLGELMKTGSEFLNAAFAGGLQMMNAFGVRSGKWEESACCTGHPCCGCGYEDSRCHDREHHSCCNPCVRGC